jgi:hypothetical protein
LVVRLARAVPAWAWLAGIVLVSFLARAWLARAMVAPFVFVDELIYAELAKNLADSGQRLVRGVPAGGYGVVYPLLIAPAYAIFDRVPEAYTAVKTINSLVMSLAAVPAYFLARRVVPTPYALGAAALTVLVPSMAYTGTVLTENAFYPVFLTAVLMLVLALERPTLGRQALLLGAIGFALATRLQAVALVPALLTAPLLLALFERSTERARRLWPTFVVVGAATLLVVLGQLARGRPISELLGAYAVVVDADYDVGEALRYLLYHWAELDLYVGVVPFAATIVLVALARTLDPPLRAFLAATLAVSFWLLLVVAVFAAQFADRIQERNAFVVAPLFLIALLAWVQRGAPRPLVPAVAAAIVATLGILAIPFERFIDVSAQSDTLMMLFWWWVQDFTGGLEWIAEIAVMGALVAAGLFLAVPRRFAWVLPVLVGAYFVVTFEPIWRGPHGIVKASQGALFQGIRGVPRDWIDRAVPKGQEVAVLYTGRPDRFTVNQNEFFNRRVGQVYYTSRPTDGGIGEQRISVGAKGVVRTDDGRAVAPSFVLADGSTEPVGRAVARDPLIPWGMTVWRVDRPLTLAKTRIQGLYPDDTWSGRTVTWSRDRCRGGTLTVSITSDERLFRGRAQEVRADSGDSVVVLPNRTSFLSVPVQPDARGVCRARFTVTPTAVPQDVLPDSEDPRVLGAHFNTFSFDQ